MDICGVQQNRIYPFLESTSTKQWEARLTRDRWIPVSCKFGHHQRPPLFPWERNFTLIA